MPTCPNCGVCFDEKQDDIPYAEIIGDLNTAIRVKERKLKGFNSKAEAHRRLIRQRWSEGHRLDDFKLVHRNMAAKWLGTDQEAYLRPSTLYCASKFEGYANTRPASEEAFTALYEWLERSIAGDKSGIKHEVARNVGFVIGWDRVMETYREGGKEKLRVVFDKAFKDKDAGVRT